MVSGRKNDGEVGKPKVPHTGAMERRGIGLTDCSPQVRFIEGAGIWEGHWHRVKSWRFWRVGENGQ